VSLFGAQAFFTNLLTETEALNNALPDYMRVGIIPGRLNNSRIESEFGMFRCAFGHGRLSGQALIALFKRRLVELCKRCLNDSDLGVHRPDYMAAGLGH
jgi:hypothetical protein